MGRLTLILSLLFTQALASDLPQWVKESKLSDSNYHYVICSNSAIDPEEARQTAEGLCLASAAKLGGVLVTIKNKTVSSLTGVDSSEVAEVLPLVRRVRCDFTDRYQDKIGNSYQVYLRCRVRNEEVEALAKQNGTNIPKNESPKILDQLETQLYKRAIASVTMLPKADKVIIGGSRGDRVVDPSSNTISIELKEGDSYIELKKHAYKTEKVLLGKWRHGQTLSLSVNLTPEMQAKESK